MTRVGCLRAPAAAGTGAGRRRDADTDSLRRPLGRRALPALPWAGHRSPAAGSCRGGRSCPADAGVAEAALLPRVPGKAAESRRGLLLGEQQQPGAAPGARPGRAEGLPSRYRAQTGGAAGLPLAGSRRAAGGRCGVLGGRRRSWSGLCSVTPSTATGVGGRPRTASTEPRRVRRGGGAGRQRARGPPGGACHCSPGTERARPAPRVPASAPAPPPSTASRAGGGQSPWHWPAPAHRTRALQEGERAAPVGLGRESWTNPVPVSVSPLFATERGKSSEVVY